MPDKTNLITHYMSAFFGAAAALSFNQWISMLLAIVALCTFGVNWYYKHQALKIAKRTAFGSKPEGENHE